MVNEMQAAWAIFARRRSGHVLWDGCYMLVSSYPVIDSGASLIYQKVSAEWAWSKVCERLNFFIYCYMCYLKVFFTDKIKEFHCCKQKRIEICLLNFGQVKSWFGQVWYFPDRASGFFKTCPTLLCIKSSASAAWVDHHVPWVSGHFGMFLLPYI